MNKLLEARKPFYNTTIPNDWKVVSLDKIVKKPIVYGIVQAGPEVDNGVPYIKSTDVGGDIIIENLSKTSEEIARKYARSEVLPGDIVFSLRGNIGELSIVPEELPVANLTQGTARIATDSTKHNTHFIRYVLHSPPVFRHIIQVSKGSTFSEISLEELRKIKLPIPSLEEQTIIANVLGLFDNTIRKANLLIEQKELRKKWMMQQLLTGKKRLNGFSGVWKKCTASSFFTQRNEQAPNNGVVPLFSLTIEKGVTEKSDRYEREFLVKDKSTKNYKIVYPNDIVFNPANLRWGAISKHTRDFNVLVSPIYEVLSVRQGFDIDFISYLVSSPRQISYYASILEGTLIERMAVKAESFLAIKYEIPSLQEQIAIAKVLKSIDKEISLLKAKVGKLNDHKRGLMQVLLTGKKRLTVKE